MRANQSFDEVWANLRVGLENIIQVKHVSGMKLVEDVYRLCTAQPKGHSERLYYTLKDFLTEHVTALSGNLARYDGDVLGEYRRRWVDYRKGIQVIHMIFRYLNCNWIKKTLEDGRNRLGGLFQSDGGQLDVYEVYRLGLLLWKESVFDQLKGRVLGRVLELIQLDRRGEEIDVALCAQTIESVVCIGAINKAKPLELYKEELEALYVRRMREFYRIESLDFIDRNGVSEYMKRAESRIAEEERRAKAFLDKSSLDHVRKQVDDVLIDSHRELLQVECATYMERATSAAQADSADVADLRRMYALLSRVPNGVDPMLSVLRTFVVKYVKDQLTSLGKKADQPQDYCEVLLDAYSLFSTKMVELAFQNAPKFVQTLDKAFRQVLNETRAAPELLARYCDALLRKGKNKGEAQDLDSKLESVITIFRYLDDKDIFQKFYSKYLARRLIYGTSVSDDSEAGVLSHLKLACGFEYTSKLQRMFTDMTLCEDVSSKFQSFLEDNEDVSTGPVRFSAFVLTQGSWPLQVHKTSFNAPPVMQQCLDAFLKYYDSVHQCRRLTWLHHLGKADVRINCLKKKYVVTVTDFQCGVLVLFNDRGDTPLSWAELVASLNMSASELDKTMQSLVASKLVVREGNEKNADGATYLVNKKYSNKHLKFKITSSVQAETDKDKKKTYKSIDEDRTLFLQALIVRIMKARKTLTHNQLMQEVIAQASGRFQPSVSLIKKQIEQLLEKEYLSRDEGSSATLNYEA